MAQFNDSQVTEKGHHLLAKVLSKRTSLDFTKIKAGDGYFEGDIWELTEIISPKLNGKILSVKPNGRVTEVEGLLTNETLTEYFTFRELGIYARDPEEGEILFAYTNASDKADYMAAYNGQWLAEEHFTIQVYTANASNITAQFIHTSVAGEIAYDNRTSGMAAVNVQDAINELKEAGNSSIHVSVSEPSNWKSGEWWYKVVGEREIDNTIHENLYTIPYDPSKPYHIEIEKKRETIVNTEIGSLMITEL